MESQSYLRNIFEQYGRIVSIDFNHFAIFENTNYEIFDVCFEDARDTFDVYKMDISGYPRIKSIDFICDNKLRVAIEKLMTRDVGEMNNGLYRFFSRYGQIKKIDPISDDGTSQVVFEHSADA